MLGTSRNFGQLQASSSVTSVYARTGPIIARLPRHKKKVGCLINSRAVTQPTPMKRVVEAKTKQSWWEVEALSSIVWTKI